MKILFIHHYFPGQFTRIARDYVARGHDVIALHRGLKDGRSNPPVDGVRMIEYGQEVEVDRPESHSLYETEQYVRESASVVKLAVDLRSRGWVPDLVYGHTGWGTGAFVQDVFPDAKYVKYCEWFYNNSADSTEFLEGDRGFANRFFTSLLNMPILADLMRADLLMSPTEWQKSQFPPAIRSAIRVLPDGIDMDVMKPDPDAIYTTPGGRTFSFGDRVVTYVARGADPFRGFKPFIEALQTLQKQDAEVEAIIVGDRTVYYGSGHDTEDHYNQVMASADLDMSRTHFVGALPYESYRKVLQVSAAHIYLTVPFVLSWSSLEALATGCAVIGSDTAPVREFITHGENGLLADFFDPAAIAAAIAQVLNGGEEIARMRRNARDTILTRWEADHALRLHRTAVESLFSGDAAPR
ncbi:glycosyltransferase involved in cell wall biosynthesis [Rhizobium sp. SG_E_25_P2]|uniref:glycosyltransferase n=1 Tax=Rhizobium sp. SG_E_25_P2 TaxID=2879942 RepID=UPI00247458F4|nr:glycosyltransferase [Rhizobium sp. SG_E_25_P2]MDH6269409.1 glycosyltransferase involved in cell wall biosynthesis [Rhizobium sp. SG_E_25_P2]